MKKYLILIALVFIPFLTKADTLLGFADGSLYNSNGALQYICFLDGSCLDKDNNQTTRQALGLAPVPQTVSTFPSSTAQTVYVPVYIPTPLVSIPSPDLISDETETEVPFSNLINLTHISSTQNSIGMTIITNCVHAGTLACQSALKLQTYKYPKVGDVLTVSVADKIQTKTLTDNDFANPYVDIGFNFDNLTPNTPYDYTLRIDRENTYGITTGTIVTLNGINVNGIIVSQCQIDINNFKQQILDIQSKLSSDQQALQGQGRGIPLSIIQAQQAQLATTASQQIQDIEEQIAQENCSN